MSGELQLQSLGLRYPGQRSDALDDVSLRVEPGRLLAVAGPSGSGKSTLLRVVAGLLDGARGDVRLAGRSLLQVPAERRGISMMFQKPLLFPHLDVLDNVAFADRAAGVARRRAREAARGYLDVVHLGDLAGRRPRELSGGQEQRVALARALAARPEVLLLDEPFSALDPELRSAMHALLEEVRATFAPTTVMVTHDLAEVGMADTVAVLDHGRLVQHAGIDELYSAPAALTVTRLLGGFAELPAEPVAAGYRCALGVAPSPSSGALPPGPAVVVVRQEAVRLVGEHDPDAVAVGLVVGATRSGTRQVATIETGPPTGGGPPGGVSGGVEPVRVLAELAPGVPAPIGRRVGLGVTGPLTVVPAAADADPSVDAADAGGARGASTRPLVLGG